MTGVKVAVPYALDAADFQTVYLAIVPVGSTPTDTDWQPAYRDVMGGRPVVFVRHPEQGRRVDVWVRDRDGARRIGPRRT